MRLYHASPLVIEHPDVHHSRNFLDFGKGFYLTSLYEQAEKYALRFLLRGEKAYINKYELDGNYSADTLIRSSSKESEYGVVGRFSVFFCGFYNGMEVHECICPKV